jgi:adenosine kinase
MTKGEAGALITVGTEEFEIPAAKPRQVLDPTGAGDAFRAGFILGVKHGLPWPVVGRLAALAGVCAIEHKGPQQHAYTVKEFVARYEENFGSAPEIAMVPK